MRPKGDTKDVKGEDGKGKDNSKGTGGNDGNGQGKGKSKPCYDFSHEDGCNRGQKCPEYH